MIPVLDLKAQYESIKDEIDAAIKEVLLSGQFILGPAVRELEDKVAAYCGCKYGVGVASGTDALRLTLTALGIGPGDEVITTPFTFIATANTISHCGARPVFVDIDPRTYNIDPNQLEDLLVGRASVVLRRPKAIVPVHLYGQPADMDPIMELAERYGLFVVEDCAQAIGARYRSRRMTNDERPMGDEHSSFVVGHSASIGHWSPVGSIGHAGCLSFFPSKNLGAYGDGGMVVTNDAALAEKVDILRRQGSKKKYHAEVLGFNSRLDTLQAAILGVKLKYLDGWNEARRRVAQRYNELLAGLPVTTPYESPDVYHVYHQYTIRAPQRDALAAYLKERGIGTMVYYPVPLHLQKLYADLGYGEGSLPASEAAAREVLSLPMYPELTEAQQYEIAEAIREFYG
ncbi:MAG: DegT/DnrJ/EryC1/StrS family aminotransferase [Candidatus Methanomethylicaceae archaeon]